MEKYVVSGCLAGICCRYDCKNNYNPKVAKLIEEGKAIPLCPEQLGGLPTPREASECVIINGEYKVITKSGGDNTEHFQKGAEIVLEFCQKYGIKKAILQKNSPSCGVRAYDGTFTRTLSDYPGITAKLLMDNGIEVISSEDLENID